jgi:hypothetical protein
MPLSKRIIQIDALDHHGSKLSDLALFHGTDKGGYGLVSSVFPWPHHTYTDFYSKLFTLAKNSVVKVFECGLGTNNPAILSNMTIKGRPGASLRMWRDFFPNALIVGADIDNEILFEEERILTFYVDQTSARSIESMWETIGVNDFDVIIDDGLHTFEAGLNFFEHSFKFLKRDGVYIIEDVSEASLLKFQDYFKDKDFRVDYVRLKESKRFIYDNNLIVIWNF